MFIIVSSKGSAMLALFSQFIDYLCQGSNDNGLNLESFEHFVKGESVSLKFFDGVL